MVCPPRGLEAGTSREAVYSNPAPVSALEFVSRHLGTLAAWTPLPSFKGRSGIGYASFLPGVCVCCLAFDLSGSSVMRSFAGGLFTVARAADMCGPGRRFGFWLMATAAGIAEFVLLSQTVVR